MNFRRASPNWPAAHRAAYLVVHDAALAEDIAQEAFLAALRNLDRFDRRRPFGPWLHRIVVNRAIDAARARSLRREAELTVGAPAAPDPEPVDDAVLHALGKLPPEQRGPMGQAANRAKAAIEAALAQRGQTLAAARYERLAEAEWQTIEILKEGIPLHRALDGDRLALGIRALQD